MLVGSQTILRFFGQYGLRLWCKKTDADRVLHVLMDLSSRFRDAVVNCYTGLFYHTVAMELVSNGTIYISSISQPLMWLSRLQQLILGSPFIGP